jgi:hypothetical protein
LRRLAVIAASVTLATLAAQAIGQERQATPKSKADVAAAITPGTVAIHTRRSDGSGVVGTGFIVDPSGTVITNFHVVAGGASVEVTLPSDEAFPVIGVKAVDQRRDIAVIQVAGFKLPTVPLGDSSSVRPGDSVLVVGNALGLLDNSVTAGIVSGIRDAGGYRLIQMDAAISHGNSGGPVVNERGEVIGLSTSKLDSGESLNFAVPINYARGLLSLPLTMGLAMLAQAVPPALAADRSGNATPTSAEPFPTFWRSTATGNVKQLTLTDDRLFVESAIDPSLKQAGASSTAELKKTENGWVGVHRERVNCRPFPLTRRKVCPVVQFSMTITTLTPSRIEGYGEEPLNSSAFDCRRCAFLERNPNRPFLWVPQ